MSSWSRCNCINYNNSGNMGICMICEKEYCIDCLYPLKSEKKKNQRYYFSWGLNYDTKDAFCKLCQHQKKNHIHVWIPHLHRQYDIESRIRHKFKSYYTWDHKIEIDRTSSNNVTILILLRTPKTLLNIAKNSIIKNFNDDQLIPIMFKKFNHVFVDTLKKISCYYDFMKSNKIHLTHFVKHYKKIEFWEYIKVVKVHPDNYCFLYKRL